MVATRPFSIDGRYVRHCGDFPGVARADQRAVWLSFCPDPNLILGIDATCFPPRSFTAAQIRERRATVLGSALSLSYQQPLKIVRGRGQYLYDADGNRWLDSVNNVTHVGQCHPHVVEAATQQIRLLNTNTRYLHDEIVRYAERLARYFPKPLNTCFFVNSGSEATELAIRMARVANGHEHVWAIENGYHGNTGRAVDVSHYKFARTGGNGPPNWVGLLPMPDLFRGQYCDEENAAQRYSRDAIQLIDEGIRHGSPPAALIAESILSCGGQVPLPADFASDVYAAIRRAGGLVIADEVQTGFGRVGEEFWAFELLGVVPDIVTLGKPIGNGHPLGAVITTREIANSFDNGMEYFNTFGGNPVSCAVGNAVLDVIEGEGLASHAAELGSFLLQRFAEITTRHELAGDARGRGLFLGIEFVRDDRNPATEETRYIVERMKQHGILASRDGPDENVIKFKPPMVFTRSDADYYCDSLESILNDSCFG